MIGYLKGKLMEKNASTITLNVADVGYEIEAERAIHDSQLNSEIEMYIYTYVKEDALKLFGFKSRASKNLFEKLISISGIGPKIGIGIFSLGTYNDITDAIQHSDVTFFTRLPKLGKKNAQKIIIELKNKVGGEDIELSGDSDQLVEALRNFGFSDKEAYEAYQKSTKTGTLEERMKDALKYLGK